MRNPTTVKWHEIINEEKEAPLPFLELYREYADALKARDSKKKQDGYWPFPRS